MAELWFAGVAGAVAVRTPQDTVAEGTGDLLEVEGPGLARGPSDAEVAAAGARWRAQVVAYGRVV